MNKLFKSFLIIMIVYPLVSLGQFIPDKEVGILMSPENPKPGESVFLSIESNLGNLDDAQITWSVDGRVEKSGIGEKTHRIITPNLGSAISINLSVRRSFGSVVRDSIVIRPAKVSLIWEADSYTPIFYKGKGLASHQSNIKVVAIPSFINSSGVKIDKNELFYNWSFDDRLDKTQSGKGESVFSFTGSIVSVPKRVSVLVSNNGSSIVADESILIDFVEPELVFYRENKLTGIRMVDALNIGVVKEEESTFLFEPYYFSKKAFENSNLEFEWRIDGKDFPELNKSRGLTYSPETAGRSRISIEVLNPSKILQRITRSFNVLIEK